MNWKIEFDSRVEKDLKKIGPQARQKVFDYFEHRIMPSADPRYTGSALKSRFSGMWRYRIGNLRAICKIEDATVTILVLRVSHRKDVHR